MRKDQIEKHFIERRKYFSAENFREYNKVIEEESKANTAKIQTILREVLSYYQITEEKYEQSCRNVKDSQKMVTAQMGKIPYEYEIMEAQKMPKLAKEKFLEAFEASNQLDL